MMSKSVRLFVGNLPSGTTDDDVAKEFSYYGTIDKAEVKQKTAQDSSTVQTFAFVTIATDDRTLEQLLREFKEQQFRGQFLQVSVARENFLEKLKREREEASEHSAKKANEALKYRSAADVSGELPSFSVKIPSDDESSSESSEEDEPVVQKPSFAAAKGNSRYFGSDDEQEEEEVDSTFLKKKSKRFLENGKIKIDRTGCDQQAIHVINKKTAKAVNQLDEKSKMADDKRKESVQKMKQSYDLQKSLIKNALAGVDGPKKNKVIFFDEDGDSSVKQSRPSPKASAEEPEADKNHKPTLFDDENDDDEEFTGNFEIKEHLEGEKGKRLMKLQSRYHGDSRFKLDAKFMEDDHEMEDDDQQPYEMDNEANVENNDEEDERRWQYNILEGVVGRKLYQSPKDAKKKAPPTMLRFDPTRSDHSKFVEAKQNKQKRKKNKDDADIPAKRSKGDDADELAPQSAVPPVSMEHFYEVRGDFQKSLGGGGFSLLGMFNRTADDGLVKAESAIDAKTYEEKLIAKNSVKFLNEFDPFKSHESSDEEDGKADGKMIEAKELDKSALKHEPFFILSASDPRLAEGLLFFRAAEKVDGAEGTEGADGDYNDDQRQELRNIVKRKMKKSIQNALPRHAKANKKFKRFARNL